MYNCMQLYFALQQNVFTCTYTEQQQVSYQRERCKFTREKSCDSKIISSMAFFDIFLTKNLRRWGNTYTTVEIIDIRQTPEIVYNTQISIFSLINTYFQSKIDKIKIRQ